VKRAGEFIEEIKDLQGNILISTHAILMKGILEYLTPDSNGREEGTLTSSSEVAQSRDGLPASKMQGSLIGISLGKIKHWCGGTEYYIEELCIRSDLQGKGYGRTFFKLIEEKLSELGLHTIYLMTDRNQPAYEFYKKLGFRELPELTSFFKEF